MADHEQKSLELLEEIDALQSELRKTYRIQALGHAGNHSSKINDLHQRIGVNLKLADIHATHALRQAIEYVASLPRMAGL